MVFEDGRRKLTIFHGCEEMAAENDKMSTAMGLAAESNLIAGGFLFGRRKLLQPPKVFGFSVVP